MTLALAIALIATALVIGAIFGFFLAVIFRDDIMPREAYPGGKISQCPTCGRLHHPSGEMREVAKLACNRCLERANGQTILATSEVLKRPESTGPYGDGYRAYSSGNTPAPNDPSRDEWWSGWYQAKADERERIREIRK